MSKDCTRKAETTKGERPYLVYRCKKAARRFYEVKEIEHIATPLAFKTLDYYLTLRERSRHADEDFLYIDESSGQYPVKEQLFRRRYRELFRLYHPESAREIEGIEPTKFKNDDRLWCIPAIHSYRVNVFSAMANQGVPYPFIEKMMSHSPSAKSDNCYYSGVKTVNKVWEDLCDEDNIDDFSIDE